MPGYKQRKCIENTRFSTRYLVPIAFAWLGLASQHGAAAGQEQPEWAVGVAPGPIQCDDEYSKNLGTLIRRLMLILGGYPIPADASVNSAMERTTEHYLQSGIPTDLSAAERDELLSTSVHASTMLGSAPPCLNVDTTVRFRDTLTSIQFQLAGQ